jgi:flagellar hook-length control protein FliK
VPPATAAASAAIAGLAAPAADHKITLHPIQADPNPAPPTVTSAAPLEQAALAPPPTVPTASSVAAAPRPQPASPAEQVAPALLTLAKTGGGQQIMIRLQPADLGMVQIRIAQAAAGTTQINITAENPATLLALQRDQPQLHHTLDAAGIPAAGRTVTFHVAQSAQIAAGTGAGTGHAGSQHGSASRNSSGADSSPAGQGGYLARERNTNPAGRRPAASPATAGPQAATATQSYRIGLDITA